MMISRHQKIKQVVTFIQARQIKLSITAFKPYKVCLLIKHRYKQEEKHKILNHTSTSPSTTHPTTDSVKDLLSEPGICAGHTELHI